MNLSNRQLFLNYVGQTSDNSLALEITRANGIYFYSPEGKRYIDLVSGVSVSSVGHSHPAVVDAVKRQVDQHMHLMVYGELVHSPQSQYASWLVERLPSQLNNVYYVNSGSEAIEGAMKLAKRSTGRSEIVAFKNAYHGSTHGALSLLGDDSFHSGYLPLLPGVRHIDFNSEEQLDRITEQTAAVILEPIQAEAGILEPRNNFLSKVRERCNETGALFVLDEIQTGMGRTGKLFAFEHYDVVPDILCVAKSFGGGMPLGAFISNKERMHTLTFSPALGHITTFGGHPVSCAAGLAAQRVIEEEKLISHSLKMESLYRDLLESHEAIDFIRGRGLFLAVVVKDGVDTEKMMKAFYDKGIILDQFLFCRKSFRIAPPLNITDDEVRMSVELLREGLDEAM